MADEKWWQTPVAISFIAGGCAGAVSRTVVSPFERMKIIFQVQGPNHPAYRGMFGTLAQIWKEEGWRGYMRGNGLNCIRIIPYSAVQFSSYTILKSFIVSQRPIGRPSASPTGSGSLEATSGERMLAGSIAGVASVLATYPMDLIRTRLSIQTSSIKQLEKAEGIKINPPGFWEVARSTYKNEGGFKALWRGLIPTTLGVAPYVGINFTVYEYLRGLLATDGKFTTLSTLAAGATAGAVAQTFTYPFDVLRRRFQVGNMSQGNMGFQYNSTFHAFSTIIKKEGFIGIWRGLGPNLLKVVPAMASSFWTYEVVKGFLIQ